MNTCIHFAKKADESFINHEFKGGGQMKSQTNNPRQEKGARYVKQASLWVGCLSLMSVSLNSGVITEAQSLWDATWQTIKTTLTEGRVMNQEDWSVTFSSHRMTLTQTLSGITTKETEQPLTYRLINQKGEILDEQVPTLKQQLNGQVQAKVTFDLSSLTDETYLYLELTYKGQTQRIKHQSESAGVYQSGRVFRLVTKGDDLMLLNQNRSHYTYQSHAYFAEQLHLTISESAKIQTYQLKQVGSSSESGTIGSTLDQGIDLKFIDEGLYYVYLNEKPVYVTQSLPNQDCVWYTITRNGVSKRVELTVEAGILALNVQEVTELPEGVYDLLIDPGHGGTDPGATGNGTTEAKEVLKVSAYIAQRLNDHGLKVKLTREGMEDPATNKSCDYTICPYLENGRIEQIYQTQSNYVISNHLNASASKQSSGTEVYSSVKTSNLWSSLVIEAFEGMGRTIGDLVTSQARVSNGSYKRALEQSQTDFYYMMRESGGILTSATAIKDENAAYTQTPRYGAEVLLVEYAYIDHVQDYQEWMMHWETFGELVVKATVQYLGVPYRSPAICD